MSTPSFSSADYFQLFGLPQSYEVDLSVLEQRYRQLQLVTHPDKFASATGQEQRLAMTKAAQVNDGYQTLIHPVRRGHYLLEKRFHHHIDKNATINDPEFLMWQMELREELQEIPQNPDSEAALEKFSEHVQSEASALESELAGRFAQQHPDVTEIASALAKMQFVLKLKDQAEQLEEQLLDY